MLRLSCVLILLASPVWATGGSAPKYVWPLGDTSVYKEVMSGRDAHLPATHQCFVFKDGVDNLPYKALSLSGERSSFVDFYLNGQIQFTDFTLSLYIYPDGQPEGTILNYLCETGNVIKIAVLQGLLFVSFWDEYGVSVGATALPELLVPDTWNHLVVSRHFDTGTIKVYHNGQLMDDIDDDFPNGIPLPVKGSMRLGSSQKDEEEPNFKGAFACFQFYLHVLTQQEVKESQSYCLPEQWRIVPEINLEERDVNGVTMECVTDYVEPSEDGGAEPKECDVIDRACLESSVNWKWVMRKNEWTGRKLNQARFTLVKKDYIPEPTSGSLIGDVTVDDRKICPRLCLKVEGCKSYASTELNQDTARCLIYKAVPQASELTDGATYFSIV